MELKRVWIVSGQSGEYEDHMEWPVCFYLDEASADRHATAANEEERRVACWIADNPEWRCRERDAPRGVCRNKYDPRCDPSERSYTGVEYFVHWVDTWAEVGRAARVKIRGGAARHSGRRA